MTVTADRIKHLVETLIKAKAAYYGGGNPIMSDAAYDALEDELRKLDPNNAFFGITGAPVAGKGWAKVKHGQPMGSLNKAQTQAEFETWFASVKQAPVVVMRKCDGASLSIRYENGKLVQAVSRGDGEEGQDITRNVLLMKGVVKIVPNGFSGFIRAEVVVKHNDFKTHFPGQANPRNTANGTMLRQTDADACKHLSLVAYQVIPDSGSISSKEAEFATLDGWGFETAGCEVARSATEVADIYDRFIKTDRKATSYDIDGLVVEVNDYVTREGFGSTGGKPKGAVAFKFPHEEKETIIRSVEWQVGKSGRITPVAVFDPVNLAGAMVERASLANVGMLQELKLYPGCRILVSRRNDVIPRVESNLDLGITP